MARPKGSKNKHPKSWQLMEELLARDFDLVDEITALFTNTQDDRIKSDLLKVMIEYIFPKAATTQLLINKSYSEEVQKLTPSELADELEKRAALLREPTLGSQ